MVPATIARRAGALRATVRDAAMQHAEAEPQHDGVGVATAPGHEHRRRIEREPAEMDEEKGERGQPPIIRANRALRRGRGMTQPT